MRCPSCNYDNRPDRRFCVECGAPLALKCSACGSPYEAGEKFCGACGASLGAEPKPSAASSRPPAVALGPTEAGERRQLTALFCDLVGSTDIASRLDPEEWHPISKEYQKAAANAVTRFGGHVDKFLGDGLVCFFGVPHAHEDDAERAVRAGLAIVEAVLALNARISRDVHLQVRVGLHTGTAVVAHGGGEAKDVFGDTPNIAARVQSVAEADSVFITAATHRLVAGRFVVEERGTPTLKGLREPLALFRVVRPSGVRGRIGATVAAHRHFTPFVGREDEQQQLWKRWELARGGEGQVVLISGEPGIGKSRLVQELKERLAGEPHTWIECAGSAYHQSTPFYAVVDMLQQGLAWRGDESAEERLGQLEQNLAAAGLPLNEAVPLMAPLLSLPVPERYPKLLLSSEAQRRQTLRTLVAWLFASTRMQPVVAVLEDLHWVDPSTIELQALLVEQGATVPLLLLYTARPEFRTSWPLLGHHAQITLNRLTKPQVREMVERVAAHAALPADMVETVVTRTDGVPLFIEELTKTVLEAPDTGTRAIPTTLEDSLRARLDRLGPAKEVAEIGAVIGREFSYEVLREISAAPGAMALRADALQAALDALVNAELVYVRGVPPAATYVFKHALVRDAAYASLLKSRRSELHRCVAQVMTERFPAVAEAQPQVLARHWTDAGEAEPAIASWTKAAEAAQARHAFKEAEENYRQALAMLGTLPESPERDAREAQLASGLAQVLFFTRGYNVAEAAELGARVRVLGEQGGNLPLLVLNRFAGVVSAYVAGDYIAAAALADLTLDLAQREGSDASLRVAHAAQLRVRLWRGDLVGAEAHFTHWKEIGDTSGYGELPGERSGGMGQGGLCAWTLGHTDVARARSAQATAFARDTPNSFDLAVGLVWEGWLCVWLREPERAQDVAAHALALCDENGFPYYGALARVHLGWAQAHLGRTEAGVVLIQQGVTALAELGARLGTPDALTHLAEAQMLDGALTTAATTIGDALAANPEELVGRPRSLICRGDLQLMLGQNELAEADFRDAITLARSMQAKAWELRATTHLARLLRDTGRSDEARTILTEIYGWFTEGFDTRDLQDAKALLEELE